MCKVRLRKKLRYKGTLEFMLREQNHHGLKSRIIKNRNRVHRFFLFYFFLFLFIKHNFMKSRIIYCDQCGEF